MLLVGVAVFWAGADQLAKLWMLQNLTPGKKEPVVGELLQWNLTFNPGAAFSFLADKTWVFTIIAAAVAVLLIALAWRVRSLLWAGSLGLLLGGTLGNLYDRLFREPGFAVGHVVDFIHTPWMMQAIYNVADIGICCSVPVIALLSIFGVRLDGTKTIKNAENAGVEAEGEAATEGRI